MAKGDPCGVCGETRTRLVDGFFYCVECGTQDTNVQETVVEQQALADGTFTIARRSRYSVKIKEGVEMSQEWYKWHRYNFQLAGLTEMLIELGAAPSVRMKVLWIWTRYIRKFQNKEAMGPAQVLRQLEVSSSSSEEEEVEDFGPLTAHAKTLRVDRVTNYMMVAILALALNFDRSPILVSHFMRFLRWRLLPVVDRFRFVPAEVLDKLRHKRPRQPTANTYDWGTVTVFHYLPYMMCKIILRFVPAEVLDKLRHKRPRQPTANTYDWGTVTLRFVPAEVLDKLRHKRPRQPTANTYDWGTVTLRFVPAEVLDKLRHKRPRQPTANTYDWGTVTLRFLPAEVLDKLRHKRPRQPTANTYDWGTVTLRFLPAEVLDKLRHKRPRQPTANTYDWGTVTLRFLPAEVLDKLRHKRPRQPTANTYDWGTVTLRFVPAEVLDKLRHKRPRRPTANSYDWGTVTLRFLPAEVLDKLRHKRPRQPTANTYDWGTVTLRFLPAEVLDKLRHKRPRQPTANTYDWGTVTVFHYLPYMMCRMSSLLELGGPLTPDVDGMLHGQLRELRLPRALAALVRALIDLAPLPIKAGSLKKDGLTDQFPDYETTVMAYIVVALKMCFGLDDDYERRLSDAVERINEEAEHPPAYSSSPEPTGRLFSFRAWAAQLRLRALVTTRHCAPLAWARGERGSSDASMEHFQEFTSARRRDANNGKTVQPPRVGGAAAAARARHHAPLRPARLGARRAGQQRRLHGALPGVHQREATCGCARSSPRATAPRSPGRAASGAAATPPWSTSRSSPARGDVMPTTVRLSSLRAWAAQLRLRALVTTRHCAPLAWARGERGSSDASMEHFQEFTSARRRDANNGKTVQPPRVGGAAAAARARHHAPLRPARLGARLRAWAAQLRLRALVTTRHCAPLAWARGERGSSDASMEHFQEFTSARRRDANNDCPASARGRRSCGCARSSPRATAPRSPGRAASGAAATPPWSTSRSSPARGDVMPTTVRLSSLRAWAAQLRLRALVTTRHCAPLAWARGERGSSDASMEHFQEFTSARRRDANNAIRKGAKARLTDQVTMEILDRIPKRYEGGILSFEELKPAMASREPQTAIARAVGHLLPSERRKLLDEDFTQYSLEYAYRHLALPSQPDNKLFRGVTVSDACGQRLGNALYSSVADTSTVYVKNCSNKNWARTRRPTVAHVVRDSDAGYDSRQSFEEDEKKEKLETFVEEDEGRNIFDDDFSDIPIKEEKADSKDDVNVGETKDNINWVDDIDNLESAGVEDDDERSIFDSDDEVEPQFDPETFNRKEVIREMMAAAYKNCHTRVPARFLTLGERPLKKKHKFPREAPNVREYKFGIGTEYWANKLKEQEAAAKVEDLITTYRGNLHNDVLHQVEEQVRAFTNANKSADIIEPATEFADPSLHTDGNGMEAQHVDDSRDVELIENEAKNDKSNDEDSCEEHAYDPVLKSEANFDEKTHDVKQLYVKLKELPPEAEPERAATPALDDDIVAIVDEAIRQAKRQKIYKKERIIINTDIDHLVDDPKRITRYNYWFTIFHVSKQTRIFNGPYRRLEKEFENNSSRSFWFVLKECSAVLDVSPLRLYRLVTDIEQQMIKLLPRKPRKGNEPKKRGRPRKNMDKNLSGKSGLHRRPERLHKDFKKASASQSQHRPRKLGRQHETLDRNLSETSDSQEWRPETLGEDSEDSSTSEDQDRPRKRGRPRKTLDEEVLENSYLQRERSSKHLKESSTSKNQDKQRKRGRPRKTLDESSEDSDSQEWRSKKSSNNLKHAQNQGQPRKRGRPLKTLRKFISEDSDSDSQDLKPRRSSNDLKDASTTQNQDQPMNSGKSRKKLDGNLSETSDSQECRPETLSEDSEDSSTSEDQDRPRKRVRQRKTFDENHSDTSDTQECRPETLSEDSEYSSISKDQDRPGKRGRPRKTLDEKILENSDLQRERSSRDFKESSTSKSQDNPKKRGRPLKTLDESSEDSDSEEWRSIKSSNNLKHAQNQGQPRKRGKPRKNLGKFISEDSDSNSQDFNPRRSSNDLKEASTTQNQDQPRNRGKPRKSLDGNRSNTRDPQEFYAERLCERAEDTSSLQYRRRKRERPLKAFDDTPSEDRDLQQSRSERSRKHFEDENTSHDQDQPRKQGRLLKFLDESVSEDSDPPGAQSSSQNYYPPRKQVKPLKFSDESLSEDSDSQHWRSERLGKISEDVNTCQNRDHPRKQGKPLKSLDESLSEYRDLEKWRPVRSSKDLEESRTSQNQDKSRKQESLLNSLDKSLSEDSDLPKRRPEIPNTLDSSLQEDESASQKQEYHRKGERSRTCSDSSLQEDESASQKQEYQRKGGRSRTCSDSSLQEDESASQKQEYQRKGERSRTCSDSNLQENESASQKQEYQRKGGRNLLHNQEHPKKRGRPLKSLNEDHPAASTSQRCTPEKSSMYLDSSLESWSPSRNQEPPRKRRRPRKSIDGSILELSASNKGSPERYNKFDSSLQDQSTSRPHKYVAGNLPKGNTSNRSTPERPSTHLSSRLLESSSTLQSQEHPRKSRGKSTLQNRTPEIASTDMKSSLQEANNGSNNQEQPRNRYRLMDGSHLEASASQKMTPEKQSRHSIYLKIASRSQKEKYPGTKSVEVTLSEVMNILQERRPERLKPSKYLEDASDSQNKAHPSKQGKPCKSMDFSGITDRKPERPSTYLNWKPLGNASTPQNQGHLYNPERFSKYVERSLPDISAIQDSTASFLRNKTEEYSETKVISFDQF
ncbi:uncharacterized protein LOC133529874 [Cydia pomonella]|uniref:uncharacterized protein LOC133529874 n=1 Tax=Cydia pomonella TaxID=82600 RepID=UPI002ADE11DC|nr:uncharacterized protein LOC133529874 [Cydia pomonella]